MAGAGLCALNANQISQDTVSITARRRQRLALFYCESVTSQSSNKAIKGNPKERCRIGKALSGDESSDISD